MWKQLSSNSYKNHSGISILICQCVYIVHIMLIICTVQYRKNISCQIYHETDTCLSFQNFEWYLQMVSLRKLKPSFHRKKFALHSRSTVSNLLLHIPTLCVFNPFYLLLPTFYFLSPYHSLFYLIFPTWTPLPMCQTRSLSHHFRIFDSISEGLRSKGLLT